MAREAATPPAGESARAARRKANGTALTRDAILGTDDATMEAVYVPEWGGTVYVRSITAGERDELDAMILQRALEKKPTRAHAITAVFCCCDADGNNLFTEADIERLSAKRGKAMNRIFAVAERLNLLSGRDLRESEKN